MTQYKRVVGIDLGTTNSALALLSTDGSEAILWEDRFKRKTYPSVVGINHNSEFVSGWDAWNRRAIAPYPVSSIKRKMGATQTTTLGEHKLLPEEFSAEILKGLVAGARQQFESRPEKPITFDAAVITVPAYFDAPQIEATKRAGELAGLEVKSLIQEPTAAAMYYAWKHGISDANFLVYDLGGGTFDVSVIRSLHGEYQVLGIDGDNFLGGDDFDKRLAEHFRKTLVEMGYSLDLNISESSDDAVRFFLLTKLAQEVKEALSTTEVHYVARRDLFEDHDGNSVSIELEYSREEFENLVADLVDQSIACAHRALEKSQERAAVTLADIDFVLLVGGSTHVPLVKEKVKEAFCAGQSNASVPMQDEPDTCVALGAAVYAATLGGLQIVEQDSTLHVKSGTYTHESTIDIFAEILLQPELGRAVKTAALINQAGDVVALVRANGEDDEIEVAFEEIQLADEGEHRFRLELCDADGDELIGFELEVYRGDPDRYRPSGSALSNLSVLAKDIYLEVVRDHRPERQLLMERGTSLPSGGEFRFYTADRSGALLLRLYQNRYPIRTIHLSIPPETEPGTPVELKLNVDETMTIVAEGEVLGQRFWAQIEAPQARELKDWSAAEVILGEVEIIAKELWGNEARYFRNATDPLVAGIREAARTDLEKLQALLLRLEDVLDTYRNRESALTPAWERYEMLLNGVKRIVFRGDGKRQLGLSTDEWRQRLEVGEKAARAAYDGANQAAWTQHFNQIQATWESLSQDEFRFASHSDPDSHVENLKATLRDAIDRLRSDIHSFTISANEETAQIQRKELELIRLELTEKVEGPLNRLENADVSAIKAKPELDRLFETYHFVRKRLERLPTLGLVTR